MLLADQRRAGCIRAFYDAPYAPDAGRGRREDRSTWNTPTITLTIIGSVTMTVTLTDRVLVRTVATSLESPRRADTSEGTRSPARLRRNEMSTMW